MGVTVDEIVSVEKLAPGVWVWICQPPTGAFYQSGVRFKRRGDALAAGVEFAQALV